MAIRRVDKFHTNSMDLVLKFFGPVKIVFVCLYKYNLPFENPNVVNIFLMILRQINNLMIKILIVDMPFNNANILAKLPFLLLQKLLPFCLYYFLDLFHCKISANRYSIYAINYLWSLIYCY